MEKANPKAPALQIYAGNLSISIFEKKIEKGEESFNVYSFQLQRSYKGKDGEIQYTGSLNKSDLPTASLLLQRAFWDVSTLKK